MVFWATQTMAASNLLGVGETTLTIYISPTSAASKIRPAYRHHLVRRNRLILPCLRGEYKSQPGCNVATEARAAKLNAAYRSRLVRMYQRWDHLPFTALVSYLSDLRRLHVSEWPPMSSDRDTMWREYEVRKVLLSSGG